MRLGDAAERHRRPSLQTPAGSEQPLDVLGDHVDLEVHAVARRERPAGSSCSSVYGMSATEKAPGREPRHRERDAVDRHRALLHQVALEPGRRLDRELGRLAQSPQLADAPDAVHVALHDVAVEAAVGPQRPLEVDARARVAAARRRPCARRVSSVSSHGEAVGVATATAVRQQPLTAIEPPSGRPASSAAARRCARRRTSAAARGGRDRAGLLRRCPVNMAAESSAGGRQRSTRATGGASPARARARARRRRASRERAAGRGRRRPPRLPRPPSSSGARKSATWSTRPAGQEGAEQLGAALDHQAREARARRAPRAPQRRATRAPRAGDARRRCTPRASSAGAAARGRAPRVTTQTGVRARRAHEAARRAGRRSRESKHDAVERAARRAGCGQQQRVVGEHGADAHQHAVVQAAQRAGLAPLRGAR